MTEKPPSPLVPLAILTVVTLIAANTLKSSINAVDKDIKKRKEQYER